MNTLPEYTAVIRTLGKAGEKYQTLLNSLANQTHKPTAIFIYLADGSEIPKETIGIEQIFRVPKGMVAQRALDYDEVKTEWMLFIDDDMAIEPWGVEKILFDTIQSNANACAIDGFPHHLFRLSTKLKMAVILSAIPRIGRSNKGYTLSWIGTDVYNPRPTDDYAWSTSNSGNAFICRKCDFLKINFKEDLWLDDSPYAIPEDKVMYYKMYLKGLKVLTHYNSGFYHLDAATSISCDRAARMAFSSARNNYIFHEIYFKPNLSRTNKILYYLLLPLQRAISVFVCICKSVRGNGYLQERRAGIKSAKEYLKSIKN